jgi:hypothetical protein
MYEFGPEKPQSRQHHSDVQQSMCCLPSRLDAVDTKSILYYECRYLTPLLNYRRINCFAFAFSSQNARKSGRNFLTFSCEISELTCVGFGKCSSQKDPPRWDRHGVQSDAGSNALVEILIETTPRGQSSAPQSCSSSQVEVFSRTYTFVRTAKTLALLLLLVVVECSRKFIFLCR